MVMKKLLLFVTILSVSATLFARQNNQNFRHSSGNHNRRHAHHHNHRNYRGGRWGGAGYVGFNVGIGLPLGGVYYADGVQGSMPYYSGPVNYGGFPAPYGYAAYAGPVAYWGW